MGLQSPDSPVQIRVAPPSPRQGEIFKKGNKSCLSYFLRLPRLLRANTTVLREAADLINALRAKSKAANRPPILPYVRGSSLLLLVINCRAHKLRAASSGQIMLAAVGAIHNCKRGAQLKLRPALLSFNYFTKTRGGQKSDAHFTKTVYCFYFKRGTRISLRVSEISLKGLCSFLPQFSLGAGEYNCVADVAHARHVHQNPLQAQAEAAVGHRAVLAQIKVVLVVRKLHSAVVYVL